MRGWDALQPNIIEADGTSVGFLCCTVHLDHFFLSEIQLLPTAQGNGIGTELIKREQGKATELGLPIRLRVLKANRARMLYQRLGFRETGDDATHIFMEWSVA